jgi:hypothetical protein
LQRIQEGFRRGHCWLSRAGRGGEGLRKGCCGWLGGTLRRGGGLERDGVGHGEDGADGVGPVLELEMESAQMDEMRGGPNGTEEGECEVDDEVTAPRRTEGEQ